MINVKVHILPAADQRELMIKAKAGDREAHDALVLQFLPMIEQIAAKFKHGCYSLDVNDLIGEGTIGVISAIRTFDLKRKIAVSTHMYGAIRGYIQRAKDLDRLVHIPNNRLLAIRKFAKTGNAEGPVGCKELTLDDIAIVNANGAIPKQIDEINYGSQSIKEFARDLFINDSAQTMLTLLEPMDRDFIQDLFGINTEKLKYMSVCKKYKFWNNDLPDNVLRIVQYLQGVVKDEN